jgi:hypothetical protein
MLNLSGLRPVLLVALFTTSLFGAALTSGDASAQSPHPGPIVGSIDGMRFEKDQYQIFGWACQQGRKDSIAVQVFAGNSLLLGGRADRDSEPAVNRTCQDPQGGRHRFWISLPNQALAAHQGEKLTVRGIRVVGSVENSALWGSEKLLLPEPPVFRTVPEHFPNLAGAYQSSARHPRVFTTEGDLDDLVKRINTAWTFSAQSFVRLANRVKEDLAGKIDWDATYSGCDMEIYLRGFAFEPKPAYGNDRIEDQLREAMKMRPGAAPPHGAAVAASRLALYAVLVKRGAVAPAGGPTADAAALLARRILLAWADRGFRDEQGNFRSPVQLCDLDPTGKPKTKLGGLVGALTHSRGVVYSVHAQDLLEGLGTLGPEEVTRLSAFHRNMYDWIHITHNKEVEEGLKWKYSDEIYNNQSASHLAALLALARLDDDKARVEAVLYGGEGAAAVRLPWVVLFDGVIYGPSDRPLLRITPNSSDDPLKSRPAYTTKLVAAGEVNDRYRNDNPGIGYAMGTLEWLFDAAEILRIAGFDPYGYRGAHGQSIEMAVGYYACLAKNVGFYNTVTVQRARSCPDYQEYVGRVVNAVDARIVIGAYRFPHDAAITELDDAAKKAVSSGPFPPDVILFGKWRD